MTDILSLARPEIVALKAYVSARSLVASAGEGPGVAPIYLDANESPFGESGLNRYPEPQPRALVDRFCELYGVTAPQIVMGRGSDEAIDLLVRAFCRPGQDSILICPPTYGVYEISAQIQGARILRVPLRFEKMGLRLDEAGIAAAITGAESNVKIVFLCNPNNPTGTAFDPLLLARICEQAAGRALVVVDEAYAEFSEQGSMLGRLAKFSNLVVLRTLSKAWALAAARCGVAIGAPELIRLLHKVRAPYPLPSPAVQAVLAATDLKARVRLEDHVRSITSARLELASSLRRLAAVTQIFESNANFILVRFKDASLVMKVAREAGIILRDRSSELGLEGCVRITLGSPAENQRLLSVFKEVLA